MKRTFQIPKISLLLTILIISLTAGLFAGNPHVVSVTMNPPAPLFGDVFDITVTFCGQEYNGQMIDIAVSSLPAKDNADLSGNGQVFVVSRAGIDVATSQPALTPGGEIGYVATTNPNGGLPANCATCGSGSNDGHLYTQVYTVHVPPATYFPGCNTTTLYLYVGMKDNNMGSSEWQSLPACQCNPTTISWPIGTVTKGYDISKRVEGVLQNQNDLVLFSVDYSYWNGNLKITDNIPGGGSLTLVSYGPMSIPGPPAGTVQGPAIGSTSGSFTWTMGDRTGMPGKAEGTVWMLYKINTASPVPGTVIQNTANGTQTGSANQNATASIVVGQAAVSIIKDQSESNPAYGDNLTYYLTYRVNGSRLVGYQPMDDIPLGTYGQLNGLAGTAVPGWDFNPQGGTNGQWTVSDPCNTGDRIITGAAGASNQFPSLLYNGLPATNHMCKGILMTDVWINPGGYEGADALVVIRSDGPSGTKAYGLVLSVDDFIGTNSSGNIGFQRCDGATCIWPVSVNTVAITANKWWRVKIEVAPASGGNNQYQFQAKVWAKGDPEPGGWTITWTDTSPPAGFDCNNGSTWRPGIAEQHGATGNVMDAYDNFIVYEPRTSANTFVWDTPPTGITYVGQQGPYPLVGTNPVKWSLGSISDEGGTFTWWGTVGTCKPITNDGWINGDPPMIAAQSNQVVAVPICPTPIITLVKTANPMTVSVGQAVTFNLHVCNTAASQIAANPLQIWDTIPAFITWGGFVSASPGLAPSGPTAGVLVWDYGANSLAIGSCLDVSWWGTVNGVPFLGSEEYFAVLPDTKSLVEREALLKFYGAGR